MSGKFQRTTQTPQRYDALDGMRGIAALAVMFYHYVQAANPAFFHNAPLAVDIFFILSGFVIAKSYGPRLANGMSIREYLQRRLIRLWPMFLIGLLIGGPVLALVIKNGLSDYTPRALVSSFSLNAVFMPYFNGLQIHNFGDPHATAGEIFPANPPAWSLFFEAVASIAFVWLTRRSPATLLKIAVFSFMAYEAAAFLNGITTDAHTFAIPQGWATDNFIGGFPRVFYGFTLGMVLAHLSDDKKWMRRAAPLKRHFPHTFILYFLLLAMFAFPRDVKGLYAIVVLTTAAPFLVYMGSQIDYTETERQIAAFLGWISYPVYCLHFPIGRAVFLAKTPLLEPLYMKVLASSLFTLAAAILLTKFCEEPARAWFSGKPSPRSVDWKLRQVRATARLEVLGESLNEGVAENAAEAAPKISADVL